MYIRKTKDIFIVEGFYFGEWEEETSENTRKEAIDRLKEYRLNMPEYPHRLIKKREKRELYKTGGKLFETEEAATIYANLIHAKQGIFLGIERV